MLLLASISPCTPQGNVNLIRAVEHLGVPRYNIVGNGDEQDWLIAGLGADGS